MHKRFSSVISLVCLNLRFIRKEDFDLPVMEGERIKKTEDKKHESITGFLCLPNNVGRFLCLINIMFQFTLSDLKCKVYQ